MGGNGGDDNRDGPGQDGAGEPVAALAARFVDLWQAQCLAALDAGTVAPEQLEDWIRIALTGLGLPETSDEAHDDDAPSPSAGTPSPAGSQTPVVASGSGLVDLGQFDARLDGLERRLAALEAAAKPVGGTGDPAGPPRRGGRRRRGPQ